MGIEIERKFLLSYLPNITSERKDTVQGYLQLDPNRTVRVRLQSGKGYITIKGKSVGAARAEFEYEIPYLDAYDMLKLCEFSLVEKDRYELNFQGHLWEIDIFRGENAGLIVAEVELKSEDEVVYIPQWIGKEITTDWRYSNSYLARCPYTKWE